MRNWPFLVATAVFALALAGALRSIRFAEPSPPPIHAVQVVPDEAPVAAALVSRSAERTPIDDAEDAIRSRRWGEAAAIAAGLPEAGKGRATDTLSRLRERIRRGSQRDADGVIETVLLRGPLSALGAKDAQRINLTNLVPGRPYTPPATRAEDVLILTLRGAPEDAALRAQVDEMRLLRIDGLVIEAGPRDSGRALPSLGEMPWRYLGGSAIDRVPVAAIAASPRLEVLDLQQRKAGLPEFLGAVSALSTLRVLRLPAGQAIGASGVRVLAGLSALEELDLACDGLAAEDLARLDALGRLRRLHVVSGPCMPALATALARGSPALESLQCSGSAPDAAAIAALAGLPRLQDLRLEGDVASVSIAAVARVRSLRRLHLRVAKPLALSALTALPELEDLTVSVGGRPAAEDPPSGLAGVQALRLTLLQSGVGDACAAAVRLMPRLDRLELSSTSVSDAGLLAMACNPTLREIEVGPNAGITGRLMPALLHWPGLRDLRISSDDIPDAAVLACADPGQLERFAWASPRPPSAQLVDHLIAWRGVVQVSITSKLEPSAQRRLQDANERRASVPPDVPGPAHGF